MVVMSRISSTIRASTRHLKLFAIGFFMGTADLIPGVSGGTIALLSGIYERLLDAIRAVTGETLRKILKGEVRDALQSVPFSFLLPLGLGILFAIFSLAHILSWLLAEHALYVWALFMGLVLASVYVVLLRSNLRCVTSIVGFVLGTVFGYVLVGIVPMQTPSTLPVVFGSGAIAISAMILPGVSGSFMLVVMGQYQHILSAVTQYDFVTLGVFAFGCIVGLSFFARFLSWLLSRYHSVTLAVLAGIMLGSVRKIWPWKEVMETRVDEVTGVLIPTIEKNVLPQTLDSSTALVMLLCVVGFLIVLSVHRRGLVS